MKSRKRGVEACALAAMLFAALALCACSGGSTASSSATASGSAAATASSAASASPSAASTVETPAESIAFSLESGAYPQKEVEVTITAPEGCTVAYTTDGATPTASDDSGKREISLKLDGSTSGTIVAHRDEMAFPNTFGQDMYDDPALPAAAVVRASVVDAQGTVETPETRIYFPGTDFAQRFPSCLVVSLVSDPVNLLDYNTGILVNGAVYDAWKDTPEAVKALEEQRTWEYQSNATQEGKDWERPCILQLFEQDGSLAIQQDAGMRVTGGVSRTFPQKSFNIYFRDDYGKKYLDYPLFADVDSYRDFRLRAGGNNVLWLRFKDALLMDLARGGKYTIAETRPAVVFVNGEYWGPCLLSEKITDQMIHDHYGVDKDQAIIMKEGAVDEGVDEDQALYDDLMSYAEKDLADPQVWADFQKVMDVESMADYCAVRIYVGDDDWELDSNDLMWRTRDDSYNDGRWQYILYDIENSSWQYHDPTIAPEVDHLEMALKAYPLLAAALRNSEFHDLFLASLERASEQFSSKRVNELMDAYLDEWTPLMVDCYKRYGDQSYFWNDTIEGTTEFFKQRPGYMKAFIEKLDAPAAS